MKIKPEHLELLRSKITHLDTEERRLIYFNGLFPRAELTKDINRRYRWDLLYESKVMSEIDLYKYLNDNHIDTALRTIVKTI